MYAREREVVTEDFLSRDDVYNLRRGGYGGFDYINKLGKNLNGTQLHLEYERHRRLSKKGGVTVRDKKLGYHSPDNRHSGFVSEEHRIKMVEAAQSEKSSKKRMGTMQKNKHQQGEKNSQFGTIWITNEFQNLKVKNDVVIPDGWRRGRCQRKELNI